jgi:hypothetical protein
LTSVDGNGYYEERRFYSCGHPSETSVVGREE